MRILVYEHVTGGGFLGLPLPASLAAEGDAMLTALVDDLTAMAGVEVRVLRDPRFGALPSPAQTLFLDGDQASLASLAAAATQVDAVWTIAPESGRALEAVNRAVAQSGSLLIGCDSETVATCASKCATAELLIAAGIPAVPTWRRIDQLPAALHEVVLKPDDGAGCVDTWLLSRDAARFLWTPRHAVQPFVPGVPLSLSLIAFDGHARLLSCNRQHVDILDREFRFRGVTPNAIADDGAHGRIGSQIAAALPGLRGYVGVDLIQSDEGPVVLEVNPRLTTSYVGLSAALGINVAKSVLECAAALDAI